MTALGGAKTWFTVKELADLALPGLPRGWRKIHEMASAERWALRCDTAGAPLARPRSGRGGGLEFHRSLLPAVAAVAMVQRLELEPARAPDEAFAPAPSPAWAWLERQTDAVRDEARRRLKAIEAIEVLKAAGMTASAAVAAVAGNEKVSSATLWGWLKLTSGVDRADRLPALAPRRTGGGREAEVHPRAWDYFKSDYLRPERPTLAACYDRAARAAAAQGWGELPHLKTFQRKLEREVDPRAIILARNGVDELRRSAPAQERSVAELHALEHVNIDGHRWDVFVRWPDGTVGRPMMVAIQDIMSRKMLAWRIAESESAHDVRLAFADLFRLYGIPGGCTLDNGRGFASKWITGGAANRYRFKVQPDDPVGLLTALGVGIHWTLPYRGQSKPIERAFRDFCGRIATHPALAGAYTGNSPMAKPDNYGNAAIPIEDFRALVAAEIAAHNARPGRDTELGRGLYSFDQVFEESYARSPVRRATAEQLRLALLASEKVRAERKTGTIDLFGNRYWTDELIHHAGELVIARFDPDALQTEIHVYDLAGRFLMTAPVWRAVGFLDVDAAKTRARLDSRRRKHARELLDAERRLEAHELAALLPPPEPAAPMTPRVIRPVRTGRAAVAAALAPEPVEESPRTAAFDRFLSGAARLRAVE